MVSLNFMHFLSFIYSLCIITTGYGFMASSPAVKAGYYYSGASHNFPPSAINTSLLTHILYAFLVPNNVTFVFDISNSEAEILSNFTTTLHHKNPHVKALYSIGGGGIDPNPFAPMASKASSRRTFIHATIEVARKYGFDGLDLDWEFPESPKEMDDFAHLLKEWRHAIQEEARSTNRPPLLLTAAVYYSADFLTYGSRRSYPAASIKENLDWINVMSYDYHGSWNTSVTGAHAALFDPKTNLSSIYGLKSWIKAGVPGKKVVMGLPLYGKTWRHAIQEEARSTNRPPLLLTAAVYYSADFLTYGSRRSYPAASIKENLDWINVMSYDYHGSWNTSVTGAHAALFDPKTNLSSIYGLKSWIKAGVPGKKVVMGLPLYGKTWRLKDPNLHGVGAPAIGVGPGDEGVLLFSEVEAFNKRTKATIAYDVDTASVYSFTGTTWVGYDDALSITVKIGFAQALGLRGYFFWAISYDNKWKITTQASRAWIVDK